jgi:predicted ATP-grasp superfamily ATP-dependent carboligase
MMAKTKNLFSVRVLVTDAEYKHSLGIVRALGKAGLQPYVLSANKGSLCSLSKYSAGEIVDNPNIDELIKSFMSLGVDFLIVVGTNSFKRFLPIKNELERCGIKMVTASEENQKKAFDKRETYNIAKITGVPYPKTIYPRDINELDKIKERISFPCVIKGLYEVGGNMVDYVNSKDELIIKYKAMCKKYELTAKNGLPMLQEYISGFGCAFFAVYDHGICGKTFQHKRIREYPVTGGASTCAESYKNDELEIYGRKLLDYLKWNGVAMVEFKMNDKNKPILMEINPKFWGSTDLALEGGVNFPLELVNIYLKKGSRYSKAYKYPYRYHWPNSEILYLIKRPKEFFLVFKDFFNPNVDSNFWISDILPTIRLLLDIPKSVFAAFLGKV